MEEKFMQEIEEDKATLEKLLKHENNDFQKKSQYDKGYILYDAGYGGVDSFEVKYDAIEKIEVGSFYQNEQFNIYKVLGIQHDPQRNLILLCKEIL